MALVTNERDPHHASKLKVRLATRVRAALHGVPVERAFHFSRVRVRRPDVEDQRARYHATRLLWGILRLRILPGDAEEALLEAAEALPEADPFRATRLMETGRAHVKASEVYDYKLREAGLLALMKATGGLDVLRCSAGVAYEHIRPSDLGRHQIQDLLSVVAGDDDQEEPILCFAAWTLAHFTLREHDLAHVANQGAFARLGKLVVDGTLVQAVSMRAKEGTLAENDPELLTLRLIARTLRNLAGHELTAALCAATSKRDASSNELRALNRLVGVGWDLIQRIPKRPERRKFLVKGDLYEELAGCVWEDGVYKCTPYAVHGTGKDRRREAAPEFMVRAPKERVVSGEAADNISVLNEAAQALERLAAQKRVREDFAPSGVLQNVVALALAKKFDASVAFEVLMDAPREAFQRSVTLSPDARREKRPRWLVGDVARLVVQTLEAKDARPARLALQLCARLVAHDYADGADARPHALGVVDAGESDESDDDEARRLMKGDQVLLYDRQNANWSGPRSGRCTSLRGDRADVRMDRGGSFDNVLVVREHRKGRFDTIVAVPATAVPQNDRASLFLHLAASSSRLGAALQDRVAPEGPLRYHRRGPGDSGPTERPREPLPAPRGVFIETRRGAPGPRREGRADARRDVRLRRGAGRDGQTLPRARPRAGGPRGVRRGGAAVHAAARRARRGRGRGDGHGAPVPAAARPRRRVSRAPARAAGGRRVPPPPGALVYSGSGGRGRRGLGDDSNARDDVDVPRRRGVLGVAVPGPVKGGGARPRARRLAPDARAQGRAGPAHRHGLGPRAERVRIVLQVDAVRPREHGRRGLAVRP